MFEPTSTIIDCRQIGVTGPFTTVVIHWSANGSAGQVRCEAWRGQFEIDRLERDGYTVTSVSTD